MGLLQGDVLVFRAVLCFESKRHRCLACAGRNSLVKSCCAYLLSRYTLVSEQKESPDKAMTWLGILSCVTACEGSDLIHEWKSNRKNTFKCMK